MSEEKKANIGPHLLQCIKERGLDEDNVHEITLNIIHHGNTDHGDGKLEFYTQASDSGNDEECVLMLTYENRGSTLSTYSVDFAKRHFPWLEQDKTKSRNAQREDEDHAYVLGEITDFKNMPDYVFKTFCDIVADNTNNIDIPSNYIDGQDSDGVTYLVAYGYLREIDGKFSFSKKGIYLRSIGEHVRRDAGDGHLSTMAGIMMNIYRYKLLSIQLRQINLFFH